MDEKVLKNYAKLIVKTGVNVQKGQSVIININYLHFINIPRQQLLLKDGVDVQSQSASKEALKLLKEHIDRSK